MKATRFLWFCVIFYTLWLLRDVSRYGILHKERKAAEQVLIKAQGLMDQLQKTAVHADKVLNDFKADYDIKTKNVPYLLQSLQNLFLVLQIVALVTTVIFALFFLAYVAFNWLK